MPADDDWPGAIAVLVLIDEGRNREYAVARVLVGESGRLVAVATGGP